MTARTISVEGYEALTKLLKGVSGKTFVLFSGSLDEQGKSWCPDCVKADPVVERNIEKLPQEATLIHCKVGSRDYWKNINNEFRKDPQFKLKCVPTLLRIGTPQRLEEEQCARDELIQMLFTEDDD